MDANTKEKSAIAMSQQKSRWFTAEYIFYVLFVGGLLSCALFDITQKSNEACVEDSCTRRLYPGWMFGHRIDLTDIQWRDFRSNFPLLLLGAVVYLLLSHTVRRVAWTREWEIYGRIFFYFLTSLIFLFYIYGAYAFFVLCLVLGNYALSRVLGKSYLAPAILWSYNILALFSSEWLSSSYKFSILFGPSYAYLDEHSGVYRWYIGFNLVVLRMISFSMDRYWALSQPLKQEKSGELKTYEERVSNSQPLDVYNVMMYIAYVFYIPLHIAGPTITFNAFASQIYHPPQNIRVRDTAFYAVRVAFALLLMEIFLHFTYVFAISQSGAYKLFGPISIGFLSYILLHLIWLKFFIIWRFFRLWAMADNIDTIENMNRCMSNNYNLQGFWRSWHRSFNRWLVRYVYVPLGGNKNRIFNTFVVFTFTAMWHDLSLRLIAWGWLIVIFIIPESLLAWYFNQPKMAHFRSQWYYRYLCAFGAALNIFMMMVANLIGFSVGVDGMAHILNTTLRSGLFISGALLVFFSAAQIMFEWREGEIRSNIIKDF